MVKEEPYGTVRRVTGEGLPSSGHGRRAQILAIARDVFLREGYAATSMSHIAGRLGGSKGTLYNYFVSKEALFAGLMQDLFDRAERRLVGVDVEHSDLRTTLTRFGTQIMGIALTDEAVAVYRLVMAESGRFPQLGRQFYQARQRIAVRRVTEWLSQDMGAGRLKRADPLMAAEQFLNLCETELFRRRLCNIIQEPTPAEIETQVARAVATFMDAYEK